ncbi:hypothetical protein JL101_028265 [Skermanella rosea]|nr:hypothetical protein [Skermanella rosea]UEM03794.1 hypothetical protein JL101_028265 [Skermanella rosea]
MFPAARSGRYSGAQRLRELVGTVVGEPGSAAPPALAPPALAQAAE